ncbi:MAG: M12 family metallo-peptidase [Terriglobales bacterium]
MKLRIRTKLGLLLAVAVALLATLSSPLFAAAAQVVLSLTPSLSPAAARLLENTSGAFTATAVAGPNTSNVTSQVRSWVSSNPAVAAIDAAGHVIAKGPGSTTITATLTPGVSGSAVLTVTVAANPVFASQPTNTNVAAVIDAGTGVAVQLLDNLSDPLPGQNVGMAIAHNGAMGTPPGTSGTLRGTVTQTTDARGIATFADLKIDWYGQGYTLTASAHPASGVVTGVSAAFDELRVGDPCLAPTPSCSSGCANKSGDGLNDAWKIAGGIDLNGDGVITDAKHDLLLPGADTNKSDVYVLYDWMDYGTSGESCGSNSDCYPGMGTGHVGETCNSGQCVYSCSSDSDCTSHWPTEVHASDRCVNNACLHTHDPLALDPRTFDPVVARFASRGINLHVLRGKAQPHSHVVSLRNDAQMTVSCEGASSGNVGVGKYAVSLYDLKTRSDPDTFLAAYHYALFAHYSGCDSPAHCPANPGNSSDCDRPDLNYGQAGLAEISGNDVIVSLGGLINNTGLAPHFQMSSTFMHELGHNLGLRHDGHIDNVCSSDSDCRPGDTCSTLNDDQGQVCHETNNGVLGAEEPNYKPNYLSIMNYQYETTGIQFATGLGSRVPVACNADSDCVGDGGTCVLPPANSFCSVSGRVCTGNVDCTAPGDSCVLPRIPPMTCSMSGYVCQSASDCNAGESCAMPSAPGTCTRLDYSRQTLPSGGPTPGALDETNLNDTIGLGSGTADIFAYTDASCHFCALPAPTTGAVNWKGTGLFVDSRCSLYRFAPESFTDLGVQADIDSANGVCDVPHDILHGHTDWPDLSGIEFKYKFQCVPAGKN